ncbi:hypothetical protein SAMN05660485_00257 [Blastococcus fimeti]|nr:hypothetical protein SAMN05660485_00257 [Blastococcus fimeti]
MTVRDRVRIERAVLSYDWWLDLRGAPRRRRRELRTELRSNLRDATAHVGSRAAVSGLGRTRQMAAEAVPEDPTRPRWTAGLQAGGAALALAVLVALLAGLAWADGAMSADASSPARGSVTLLPGSSMEYEPLADGFSVSTGVGWLPVAVGVLVFVAVARPWRALRAQTSTVPPLRQ